MKNRMITARNSDAMHGIVDCAMYSFAGKMVYRKWDGKQNKYVHNAYDVVPIDCGVTSRGNPVLFAEDIRDNHQIKQFIIRQIKSFDSLKEKCHTAFPIMVKKIKKALGVDDVQDVQDDGRSRNGYVASKMLRIAQRVYEFSGCEGHLYSDSKNSDPYSYNAVGDDGRTGSRHFLAVLNEEQKRLTKVYTDKRRSGLSFGEYFQWNAEGRAYVQLKSQSTVQDMSRIDDADVKKMMDLIDSEGYVCPDYAQGYCYRKTDKDFSAKNAPKMLTILRKALKDDKEEFARLSKIFNERDSGTMKRKGGVRLLMCITHNPEDISGMSTDRSWTSCMRLPGEENNDAGGCYYSTALKQVKYGGMVAYLIRDDDKSIDRPLARIAIKRFENGEGGFIFKAENRIYGDEYVSSSCGFMNSLESELEKSNATTEKGRKIYDRNDGGSWSDGLNRREYRNLSADDMKRMSWDDIYDAIRNGGVRKLSEDDLSELIDSHSSNPPGGIFMLFEHKYGRLSDAFAERHSDIVDMDRHRLENGEELAGGTPYDGNDAPSNEESMKEFILDVMDNIHIGDDYGEVYSGHQCMYSGMVSPIDISGMDMDGLPESIKGAVNVSIASAMKDFYEDKKEEGDEYDEYGTFAEFEEALNSGELDDYTVEEFCDYYRDRYYDYQIGYYIEFDAYNNIEGYESSVFRITGAFSYDAPNIPTLTTYRNEIIVDVSREGWKEKIEKYCGEFFDRIPRFFG